MTKDQDIKRRDFITNALAGGLGLGLFIFSGAGEVFAAAKKNNPKLKSIKTSPPRKNPPKCRIRNPNPNFKTKCEKRVSR
ncbi:MAG: hypothetical protein V2B13_06680 [Pseudomonadota bacterium]